MIVSALLLDVEDRWLLYAYTWRVDPLGYVVRSEREPMHNGKRGVHHTIRLHRQILGAAPGQVVDHVNGHPFDNRRCNLRIATATQNARNKAPSRAVPKGVELLSSGHWRARICVQRKLVPLGTYLTQREAAEAYNRAAEHYFGSFARLNSGL